MFPAINPEFVSTSLNNASISEVFEVDILDSDRKFDVLEADILEYTAKFDQALFDNNVTFDDIDSKLEVLLEIAAKFDVIAEVFSNIRIRFEPAAFDSETKFDVFSSIRTRFEPEVFDNAS